MAVDIPNYRVIEKLGTGAQSRIFRARCMRTGKDYTVKIVKVIKPEDASFIDLLKTEHAIGSTIDHPVIRKVYELRMMRHRLRVRGAILFMEYVAGVSLLDKEFQASLGEVLRIFADVARGLDALHRAGFVHADLKPSNILVTPDGDVKLIDLGQSSRIHEAKVRIQGTIDYMAPEQVNRGVLDQRTDVFALGAALHRILTGKPIKTNMNQTISMHSQSLVGRRVSEINESGIHRLPACVARLIEDCCEPDPDDRIQDLLTVIERIELARTIVTKPPSTGASAEVDGDEEDAWYDEEDATAHHEPQHSEPKSNVEPGAADRSES
jgi:serine/threonine-protein kinase